MNNRTKCISNYCNASWYGSAPPFCSSCGSKQYSNDVLRKMSGNRGVYIVEKEEEFLEIVDTAKKAKLGSFLLIEGNIAKEIAKAMIQKAKTTGSAQQVAAAAATTIFTAGAVYTVKAQGHDTTDAEEKLGEQLTKLGIGTVGGLGTAAGVYYQGNEISEGMPYGPQVEKLYSAGYRIQHNRDKYLLLKRERTKAERIEKDVENVTDFLGDVTRKIRRLF